MGLSAGDDTASSLLLRTLPIGEVNPDLHGQLHEGLIFAGGPDRPRFSCPGVRDVDVDHEPAVRELQDRGSVDVVAGGLDSVENGRVDVRGGHAGKDSRNTR